MLNLVNVPSGGGVWAQRKFRVKAKKRWRNVCIYAKKCVSLYTERWEVVSHLRLKLLNNMKEKSIPLTESEWRTIFIALGNAICARQALVRKCALVAESGAETVYTQQEWIELAKKAKEEESVFCELRGKIFREMNL